MSSGPSNAAGAKCDAGSVEMSSLGLGTVGGKVDFRPRDAHQVVVGDLELLFWSLRPFRKRLLQAGDLATVAYLKVPLSPGLRVALAFYRAPERGVYAAAAGFHAGSIGVAVLCAMLLLATGTPFEALYLAVAGMIVAINSFLLVLTSYAKSVLRRKIEN